MDETRERLQLGGGDFAFLPHGSPHTLRDEPETPAVLWEELLAAAGAGGERTLRAGGGGLPVVLVGGCFSFDATPHALVESLPPVVHLRGDGPGGVARWLETTLQFVATEAASDLPGAEIVTSRLGDILFIQALRAFLASAGGAGRAGWLAALADPQVGGALQHMHARPGDPWTVESLADAVHMSRTAFAERFRELVGDTPLNYLTRWRMSKAVALLRDGETVQAVARAVGYESEAAFSKAFKRETGLTPGAQRPR